MYISHLSLYIFIFIYVYVYLYVCIYMLSVFNRTFLELFIRKVLQLAEPDPLPTATAPTLHRPSNQQIEQYGQTFRLNQAPTRTIRPTNTI